MQNVNGYYQAPTAPKAPKAPAAPRRFEAASVSLGTDTYRGGAAAIKVDNVAPALPGFAAGYHGYNGVKGAQYLYGKARRSRSYSQKVNAGSIASNSLMSNVMGAIKSSTLFGAVISLGLNAYGVFKGQLEVSEAGANVASDTAAAAVGGAAGCAASMVGTWALIGPMGAGLGLNLIGLGLGMAGYLAGEHLFRQSDLHRVIREKTQGALAKVAG